VILTQLSEKFKGLYWERFVKINKRVELLVPHAQLASFPQDKLIDYVILHELVHTQKKDHSRAFWTEMDERVGNGKKRASGLREYRIS